MRVFLTGATGFIGSAIVPELINAGHQVIGLARSDEGAKSLIAAGAQAHCGDLEDLESLRSGAAMSDGVIHTAFNHDFSKFAVNCETDRRAIEALGSALTGSDRPLIVTSGTGLLAPGRLATEEDLPLSIPRSPEFRNRQPPRSRRVACVFWWCVFRRFTTDSSMGSSPTRSRSLARRAFRRMSAKDSIAGPRCTCSMPPVSTGSFLRKVSAGARYHPVAEEGVSVREIAEAIGRGLKVPVVSKSPEEAGEHFGFLGFFVGLDCPASSAQTQARLGWHPTLQPGLIADLDQACNFEA